MASDENLILQAQRGDMRAFEELVQRYDGKVLSMAASFTGDGDAAKDVYQEVFLRIYRALPKFQGRSSFSTWLHRIVINVCKTHQSRLARRKHLSIDEPLVVENGRSVALSELLAEEGTAEQGLLETELAQQMRRAMNQLSPKQKLVFTLRHYHGYKLREIASMMRCAEGTVKRHLFGATRRMREQLKPVAN